MTRRPITIFAVAALLGPLTALLSQSASAAASHKLPVVACPTTRGAQGHPQTRYAKRIAAPAGAPIGLEYYSDDVRNLTPILGPLGWKCDVQVGGDGSTGIMIFPPGSTSTSKRAVTLEYVPVCQGCIYELICPLLPRAAHQLGYNDVKCDLTRPRREKVTWIKGSPQETKVVHDAVRFEDPPGVKGDGVPSGGKVSSNGVLLYQSTPTQGNAASAETCALPAVQHAKCTAILNDFVNRNWGMP